MGASPRLADADPGGEVIKRRIARRGRGPAGSSGGDANERHDRRGKLRFRSNTEQHVRLPARGTNPDPEAGYLAVPYRVFPFPGPQTRHACVGEPLVPFVRHRSALQDAAPAL